MPNNTEQPSIKLHCTAVGNGTRHIIAAKAGDKVVHVDRIDITIDTQRIKFLAKLAKEAKKQGLQLDKETTKANLLAFASECSQEAPQSSYRPAPDEVLKLAGLEVLGEYEDQKISCWVPETRKRYIVASPANWKYEEMLQALGARGADTIWLGKDAPPAGTFTVDALRQALALAAADMPRIASANIVGQGVWPHGSQQLIVNGGTAMLYDGRVFRMIDHPKLGDKVIDLNADKAWGGDLATAVLKMDVYKSRAVYTRLVELLRNWNWKHASDPRVVASLIFATFVQACFTWRPLISLIGPSDCGKSTFMNDLLLRLFGHWAVAADQSTEAGLRQAIGHDSAPVLIDEFDQYRHRAQVLQLFRTSSRGGKILRGTQNQAGQAFGVKHIPWFAAIESGVQWAQDRNRFIQLELQPPEHRGELVLPASDELAELGQQVASAAVWAASRAVKLADRIKVLSLPDVHGRFVESFSVAAAMESVLIYGDRATGPYQAGGPAKAGLLRMLAGRETLTVAVMANEQQLLADILATNVRGTVVHDFSETTVTLSVAQLLRGHQDNIALLEAKGLRIVSTRTEGQFLFIVEDVVRRELLRGTKWESSCLDQLLLRLPNSYRSQQRCAGQRQSGIMLHWEEISGKPIPDPGPDPSTFTDCLVQSSDDTTESSSGLTGDRIMDLAPSTN